MMIDSPKMQARLVTTYHAHKRRPKDLSERLRAVFDNDNEKVMAFIKAMTSNQEWRKLIGH
jgi:hypothetical protein